MRPSQSIHYCTHCGASVEFITPAEDNRPRHVCPQCDLIQYQNPKIIAGCIVTWHEQILLCQRAIEPRRGLWTIPAGFMENGEGVAEGAARETLEEACAKICDMQLYQIYNILTVNQVYILFRARLAAADGYGVGSESLAVKLVHAEEIEWETIAFRVVEKTLRRFLMQRRENVFTIAINTIK